MFVSPPPRREHPFRREKRWTCVERMLTDKRIKLLVRVHLHLKGGALEINLNSFCIRSCKIEVPRPCPLDEYGITARREIKRCVNRRGRFHDHVHVLAAQIHPAFNAWCPRCLLWSVNDALHEPGIAFVVQSVHGQTPSDNSGIRFRREVNAEILAFSCHAKRNDPAVRQRGWTLSELRRQFGSSLSRLQIEAIQIQRRHQRSRLQPENERTSGRPAGL